MALIALKQRDAMLSEQAELVRENEQLKEKVDPRRAPGSGSKLRCQPRVPRPQPMSGPSSPLRSPARSSFPSSPSGFSVSAAELEASVYDWVCEISKLSDVGTVGWKVRYSERFLSSTSDEEKRYIMGTEPVVFPQRAPATDEDEDDPAGGGGDEWRRMGRRGGGGARPFRQGQDVRAQPPDRPRPALRQEGLHQRPLVQARRRGGHQVRGARLGGLSTRRSRWRTSCRWWRRSSRSGSSRM